ncbi:hypothetical protein A9G07_11000 [Gilliamella sp. wkB72]|uniref:hypothetical protein n=1 Tax=Gilliamella sp. wkB72 TaxID=3120265 RepID=UPI000810AF36|nr:hypothetical protein [Gilliamella apicola]OCL19126.1 hypothetical protein A9G07_11000 [Gilliamella apicola]
MADGAIGFIKSADRKKAINKVCIFYAELDVEDKSSAQTRVVFFKFFIEKKLRSGVFEGESCVFSLSNDAIKSLIKKATIY